MNENSTLNQNQLKLTEIIGQVPVLYYPTFDSYLIDCGSTDYPNSQLFKNTNELRYLLEKIQKGSLEDIYPDLFTSVTINETIKLLSELNIMFNSGISINEIIELLSEFNIDFTSNITINETIKLLSELNIMFNNSMTQLTSPVLLSNMYITIQSDNYWMTNTFISFINVNIKSKII